MILLLKRAGFGPPGSLSPSQSEAVEFTIGMSIIPFRHSLGLWPGPGRRQLWKLSSQNVLRLFCGLSEAAEDSRCNGCPIKNVSERRSERNRMSDLQSPASDRAPIADTPARSDHAPIADTPARIWKPIPVCIFYTFVLY